MGPPLLRHRDIPGMAELDVIKERRFEAFKKVVTGMKTQGSDRHGQGLRLRGRGGAGFPTGVNGASSPIPSGRIMWLPTR